MQAALGAKEGGQALVYPVSAHVNPAVVINIMEEVMCMCVCVTSVLPAVRACCAFVLISGRKNAQKRVVTV